MVCVHVYLRCLICYGGGLEVICPDNHTLLRLSHSSLEYECVSVASHIIIMAAKLEVQVGSLNIFRARAKARARAIGLGLLWGCWGWA